jgi:hypothetical protein
VVWQSLHSPAGSQWPDGFPVAIIPSWQLAQVPSTSL